MTADGRNLKNAEKFVGKFLNMLPTSSGVETARWKAELPPTNEAIAITAQVQVSFFHRLKPKQSTLHFLKIHIIPFSGKLCGESS